MFSLALFVILPLMTSSSPDNPAPAAIFDYRDHVVQTGDESKTGRGRSHHAHGILHRIIENSDDGDDDGGGGDDGDDSKEQDDIVKYLTNHYNHHNHHNNHIHHNMTSQPFRYSTGTGVKSEPGQHDDSVPPPPPNHSATTSRDSLHHHHQPSDVTEFLGEFQDQLRHRKHTLATAQWGFLTNLTDGNARQLANEEGTFSRWWSTKQRRLRGFRTETFPEPVSRQIRMALIASLDSNNQSLTREISRLQSKLINAYSSAKACLFQEKREQCLSLKPGLVDLMGKSRDPSILEEAWLKWRHVTSGPMRSDYIHLVALLNRLATENGYHDYAAYERRQAFLDTPTLETLQARLWADVTPLYRQLHAHVRRRLVGVYGLGIVGTDGTIPAHVTGNMWGQNWLELYDLVVPYPEVDVFGHVDDVMASSSSSRGDVRGVISLAESFFTSLGLSPMTKAYWDESVFTKVKDRPMDCNARTFDMFRSGDFRVKMCVKRTFRGLLSSIHELGHASYCMAYAHQPTVFRTGANLATHEAVGDLVGLAVMTSSDGGLGDVMEELVDGAKEEGGMRKEGHVKKVKGKKEEVDEIDIRTKHTINRLMFQALEKVAFLPFGYLVDTWRRGVMEGRTSPGDYNKQWWKLRLEYQGIRSPSPRSETHFDPGAKYHVIANSMYSGYFIAQFLQFQMFSSLCRKEGNFSSRNSKFEASQTYPSFENLQQPPPQPQQSQQPPPPPPQPLHHCNVYGSNTATNKLRRFLSHGSSIPFQDQLSELTGGDPTVTSDAMLTYFHPLHQWLHRENSRHGGTIGWEGARINWKE